MKRIVLAIFVSILLNSSLAGASTNPSVPDVSRWTVLSISRIDIQVSEGVVSHIGLKVEYSNPIDPREFVQVIHRHIPSIIVRQKMPNERLVNEVATALYIQKEEKELLEKLSKETDPIIYVHWRTKENPRNEEDMLDGDADVWFLPVSGEWLFLKNQKIEIESLTENIGPDAKDIADPRLHSNRDNTHNVFSGMKFQVGDAYHIIRIDRSAIVKLFEERSK